MLAERLGVADLWPLHPDAWDEDTFFGLIEVFHDLAVRPRDRHMHSYNGCGWHYSGFAIGSGTATKLASITWTNRVVELWEITGLAASSVGYTVIRSAW